MKPVIYIDENLSPVLTEILNLLDPEYEFRFIPSYFHSGIKDPQWLEKIENSYFFTLDKAIKKNYYSLLQKNKIGMFYMKPPKKKSFNIIEQTRIIVFYWFEIKRIISQVQPPFICKIPYGFKKAKLEYTKL